MKPGLLSLMCLFVAGRLMGAETLLPLSSPHTRTNLSAVPKPEATANFHVKRGFRIELVASEPLVIDPIAMAFDENGRLFVLESASPIAGGPATGRVRVLEDNDAAGVFGASTIYAEDIANPTAIVCYDGGVFVAAGGQIIYFKDSKGNGVSDLKREAFKSFGDATNGANGQVIITGLAWGLDNRIHAVTAGAGGDVISSSSTNQSIVLSEGSFSFDPRTFLLTAESGSKASGLSFDDRGRRFICTAFGHIEMAMSEPRYATRNPFYTPPPATWRLPDQSAAALIYPPVHEGKMAPAPVHFSAAAGIAIYRGNAFPREYWGDPFFADSAVGIVHHDHLRSDGLQLTLERPADEQAMEFLASLDGSFQPTQVINGPDGTLYVTGVTRDMQTPAKLKTNGTPGIVVASRGRIYRVLPLNFKQAKFLALGNLPADKLVSMLRHPNGWQRDTASRLLYERQDRATIVPLIQLLFDPYAPPLARMHALRGLDGIQVMVNGRLTHALLESHLLKALTDPDDRVREEGVLISEKFVSQAGVWSDQLWGQLSQMGNDPSPQVRWQLALTLGQGHNPGRVQTLANIVRDDPRMFPEVLTSLSEGAVELFGLVMNDAKIRNEAAGQDGLRALVTMIGMKNQPAEIVAVLNTLQNHPDARFAFQTALELADGLAQADETLLAPTTVQAVRPLFDRAAAVAIDTDANSLARAEALKLLATGSAADATIPIVFARQWPNMDPVLRKDALATFLTRPEWISGLMASMQNGLIARAELDSDQVRYLLAFPEPNLRPLIQVLYTNWDTLQRAPVVSRYQGAPQMSGNAERGHAIFSRNCIGCHPTGDESNPPFPAYANTDASSNIGKQKLLVAILDPNRTLHPAHAMTLFQLRNGETLAGTMGNQTAKSVMIWDAQGFPRHLSRSSITSETSLGYSGMPEDWENILNAQDMADLLEYLSVGSK